MRELSNDRPERRQTKKEVRCNKEGKEVKGTDVRRGKTGRLHLECWVMGKGWGKEKEQKRERLEVLKKS